MHVQGGIVRHRIFVFVLMLGVSALSFSADKPRVFVTDSQSWAVSGSSGGSGSGFGGHMSGGARPQTAEIIKTFTERCPFAVVNNIREKSDYVAVLDHEGGKSLLRKDNKVAVFNKDGDSIISKSTRSLGNSVQDACDAITADWGNRGPASNAAVKEPAKELAVANVAASAPAAANVIHISVDPGVKGAEIELDGVFVATTPSVLAIAPGAYDIRITKAGYKPWQRKIKALNGTINVSPQLEKVDSPAVGQ
jgi:hypothetical protein